MADEPSTELTAAERIGRATLGVPPKGLAAVRAVDLLAVCLSIPPAKETGTTRALGRGAALPIRGLAPGAAEDVVLHVAAQELRAALEVASDHAQ